jgi:hypothetical protein
MSEELFMANALTQCGDQKQRSQLHFATRTPQTVWEDGAYYIYTSKRNITGTHNRNATFSFLRQISSIWPW